MILDEVQALERILTPKNKSFISQAVFQEERLILHGEAILEKYNLPYTAFRNFTFWWQSLISEVKYNRIDQLMNCPFFTVGIVKDIFDQLQKFLDAQDRYTDFKFTSIDFTNDFIDFLEKQNDDTFWRQRCISELKTGICSYVVVDLPAEQKTDRPEPYNYFVSPRLVKDVEINKFNGNVEFIIFRQSNFNWDDKQYSLNSPSLLDLIKGGEEMEKLILIDDASYRVYIKAKNARNASGQFQTQKWALVSRNDHGLGYCPVIDFWKDSIKGTNGINKVGPVTLQLSNLDYILFFKACIDYMNLYGPFPPLVTYDMSTNDWDDKTKQVNTGGNFDPSKTNPISNSPETQDPRKSGRNLIGPGGGFSVPTPASETDHDFMKNPMKFVGMDVKTVEHANELLKEFENNIKEKCTGIDEDYLNEIAKNTEMLSASFRKEETILSWIKSNIERVHRFVTKTKCILRYGEENFIGCTIDYGSDYLLKDATTLSNEFKESVDNGMPQGYSYEIASAAYSTRFKNNPEKLARMRILLDLEPYPTMSFVDMQLLGINVADKINFIIKANFITFISRFELENGSIVNFASKLNYSKKISIIKSQLLEYGKATDWTEPVAKPTAAGVGNS